MRSARGLYNDVQMSADTTVPTPDQATAVISTEGLTKYYGRHLGIEALDLEVSAGEIFGYLGPNGAGKTTTIRILTGFLRATSGAARVHGLDCWKDTVRVKARVGFLPDSPSLYEQLTGLEFLDYMSRLQNGGRAGLRDELCDRLEHSQADLRRKIKGYSHGMRKKLAIIQATEHDPEVLIMDEPTDALDPLIQQRLFDLLTELRSRGRTVFFSSHNLAEVERLCDRVAIVRAGRLVTVETVSALRARKTRQMDVVLAEDPPADALRLPGVLSLERQGRHLRFLVQGDINPVLRELAKLEVEDIVFEHASLEDVFLDYYRTNEAE